MTGKPQINKEKVIELLKQGKQVMEIQRNHQREINADPHRTKPFTRQTISNVKDEAITKGLLPSGNNGHKVVRRQRKPNHDETLLNLSRGQLEEISIIMYQRALQYPELENRINRLQNQLAAARNELRIKDEKLSEYSKIDLRFKAAKAAVMHGE